MKTLHRSLLRAGFFCLCLMAGTFAFGQLSNNQYYFINRIGNGYYYVNGNSISLGHLEPEAWEFQHRGGNQYRIIYRHRTLSWHEAPGYGQTFTFENNRLFLSNNSSEWTITSNGDGTSTAVSSSGWSMKWRITVARDVNPTSISTFPLPQTEAGVKRIGFNEYIESINLGRINNQQPYVRLKILGELARYNANQRYLKIDLSDTKISANSGSPNIHTNTTQVKKWYLDYAEVSIQVRETSTGRALEISKEAPDAYMGSGSIGYSKSQSLGAEFGVSSSGKDLGASASLNMSISNEKSGSYNLQDFAVKQVSSDRLKHEYQMSLCANCSSGYRASKDLVYFDALAGKNLLHDLPAAATGNFPIVSQGIFVADSGFSGRATVTVTLRFTLQAIDILKGGSSYDWGYANYEVERSFEVDFSQLEQ